MSDKSVFTLAVAAGLVAFAHAATYTVDVDDSHTFAAPLALADAQVSVDGADAVAFSTLLDGDGTFSGSGTFVKTGSGFLVSDPAMTNFTGEIQIQAGALVVRYPGDLGPESTSTAPGVTVSDGATLVFSTPAKCGFRNKLTFAGEGVTLDGRKMGAICHNSAVAQQDHFYYNGWALTGDAMITSMSSPRMDINSSTVKLNGHTLAFQPYDATVAIFCMNGTTVTPGAGGKIVVRKGFKIQSQAAGTWDGDASNEFIFNDDSLLTYWNNGVKAPWTLVWNTTSALTPNGSASGTPGGWAKTNYMYWAGPVRIEKDLLKISGGTEKRGYTFLKKVSGIGGIRSYESWLHLVDPANDFEGPVTVSGYNGTPAPCGLCLYNPGALPLNGTTTTITNAPLMMADNGIYDLPAVDYYVKAGTNFCLTGGNAGGTLAGLRKTGAGRLDLLSGLTVTGKTDLAQGTIRLAPGAKVYSAAAGLWEGRAQGVTTNANGETIPATSSTPWAKITSCQNMYDASILSNTVVDSCWEMAQPTYPPWKAYEGIIWGGYVWNRTATNETWTFSIGMSGFGRFYFDGVQKGAYDNSGELYRYTFTVTPGPHAIVFKTNPRNYGSPGSNCPTSKYPKWKAGFGFVIDRFGRNSTDAADYVFPANGATGTDGGDGYWFTRDARDVGDFTAEELEAIARANVASFADFTGYPGTVLDVNNVNGIDYAATIDDFSGTTSVSNGSLRIVKKLNLVAAEVTASPLVVADGKLIFADGAVITVDDPAGFGSQKKVPHVVARAEGGIVGMPVPDADFTDRLCRVAKSQDGKELTVTVLPKGSMLLFR